MSLFHKAARMYFLVLAFALGQFAYSDSVMAHGPGTCSILTGFGLPAVFGMHHRCHVLIHNDTGHVYDLKVRYLDGYTGSWITEQYVIQPGKVQVLYEDGGKGRTLNPKGSYWTGLTAGVVQYTARNRTNGTRITGEYHHNGDSYRAADGHYSSIWWFIEDARYWTICLSPCPEGSDSVSRGSLCRNSCDMKADACRLEYEHDPYRRQRCSQIQRNCRKRC